jgi:hypothetical protein
LDGPIYKGIFPDIRPLLPVPNFPIMIDPAQIVWPFLSVAYSRDSSFDKVTKFTDLWFGFRQGKSSLFAHSCMEQDFGNILLPFTLSVASLISFSFSR